MTDINRKYIISVDIETTGLDPHSCCVLEVAIVIAHPQTLEVVDARSWVIPAGPHIRDLADPWIKKVHGTAHDGFNSPLLDECEKAWQEAKSAAEPDADDSAVLEGCMAELDAEMREFLQQYNNEEDGSCEMMGSSVHFDLAFIRSEFPLLASMFSHRIIDVSSLRLLQKLWRPDLNDDVPKGAGTHRAMPDIMDSLDRLRFYRSRFINLGEE